jgi:hypothetical protein
MKAYGCIDLHFLHFDTSCSGQLHAPAALPLMKQPPVPIGYEVGWTPRASLDDVEKKKFLTLPGLKLRPLGRPASSQSLYRLRYPGTLTSSWRSV